MKKQPATAILGAALNACGHSMLHNYMRQQRGHAFRRFARRYVAAVTRSGKECVLETLVNDWIFLAKMAKSDAEMMSKYGYCYSPKGIDGYIDFCSPEFLAKFPATLRGYTPSQGQYWYEPQPAQFKGRPTYTIEVDSDLMGPRFMKGAKLEMQPVVSKREMQPGRVYYYWDGWNGFLFRLEKMKGRKVIASLDGDFDKQGNPIKFEAYRSTGDLFNKHKRGNKKLLMFVDYAIPGNPARQALFNQVIQTTNQRLAERNQREQDEQQKTQTTEEQLAAALRRIAELEGTPTEEVHLVAA